MKKRVFHNIKRESQLNFIIKIATAAGCQVKTDQFLETITVTGDIGKFNEKWNDALR